MIKAINEYRNHPSIIAIKERCTNSIVSFSFIEKKDILNKIKNFQVNKTTQNSDVPTNSDLFVDFIFTNLNDSIAQSEFPGTFKRN